jgi:DNA repair protein RadC
VGQSRRKKRGFALDDLRARYGHEVLKEEEDQKAVAIEKREGKPSLFSFIIQRGAMLVQFKGDNHGIKNDSAVANLLHSILKTESPMDRRDKEHFWTIGLNTRNVVICADLTSLGALNASLVHPREVFRLKNLDLNQTECWLFLL